MLRTACPTFFLPDFFGSASTRAPFFAGRIRQLAAAFITFGVGCAAEAQPAAVHGGWSARLITEVAKVDTDNRAAVGVYVQDIDTGESASYKADQRWYLASMVKVPIAITVMRGIEAGRYTLDTEVTLRAADYVDGAGTTNNQPVGTPIRIRQLLEQMIIHSDNTASDVLIDLVGIAEVNNVVAALVPDGFQRITSLSAIRRMLYGYLVPNADQLTGQDLVLLNRQRVDGERLKLLARMTETPVARFRLPTLAAAYKTYYATGLNSGRLDAYGELLRLLADGKALSPRSTDYLLKLMERVETGTHRLKAGLPADVRFAHKTGTQRGRLCDAGLVRVSDAGQQRRVVIVACTRDEPSLFRAELALKQVGTALCKSGLITRGVVDAPTCSVVPHLVPATAGVAGTDDTGGT